MEAHAFRWLPVRDGGWLEERTGYRIIPRQGGWKLRRRNGAFVAQSENAAKLRELALRDWVHGRV